MNDKINKWFELENVRKFSTSAEYFVGEPSNLSLEYILQLDNKNQKPFTKNLLESKNEVVKKC